MRYVCVWVCFILSEQTVCTAGKVIPKAQLRRIVRVKKTNAVSDESVSLLAAFKTARAAAIDARQERSIAVCAASDCYDDVISGLQDALNKLKSAMDEMKETNYGAEPPVQEWNHLIKQIQKAQSDEEGKFRQTHMPPSRHANMPLTGASKRLWRLLRAPPKSAKHGRTTR
jgi:hypothetical protein